MSFSQKVLEWYREHKRELPWRSTRDPYKIWLSEIILQQTRVVQGTPYYFKFIDAFPTVQNLAEAPEEKVLKLWQGLGYYSRARNLHATAKMVVEDHNSEFPVTYNGLKQLKGVGDYTASAIASICFDIPEPVVDGNVYRVLSRYFGMEHPINTTKGARYFKELAREVMDKENVRDYNQGIMEFGAIQCAPKNPYCLLCPLNEGCVALRENKVQMLPVKLGKTKVRHRYFNYLVLLDAKKNTLMEQRKGKGIWQNLYQFPLMETEGFLTFQEMEEKLGQKAFGKSIDTLTAFYEKPLVHKLSHQHLHTQFWVLNVSGALDNGIPWEDIGSFPVPVLIADFMCAFKI